VPDKENHPEIITTFTTTPPLCAQDEIEPEKGHTDDGISVKNTQNSRPNSTQRHLSKPRV